MVSPAPSPNAPQTVDDLLANGKITRQYAEQRHKVVFDGDRIDRVRSDAARNAK